MDGDGQVTAGSIAFAVPVTFPRSAGEPPGTTTQEEMLAASHATCYGHRSANAHRTTRRPCSPSDGLGNGDSRKGPSGIRIQSSHLRAVVDALEGIDQTQLEQTSREVEEGCTISIALRGNVTITSDVITR